MPPTLADLENSWKIASNAETAADALLPRDPRTAKALYVQARTALYDSMRTIWEVHAGDTLLGNREAERRQAAFDRCHAKYDAIASDGTVRGIEKLVPHPESGPLEAPAPPSPPPPRAEPTPPSRAAEEPPGPSRPSTPPAGGSTPHASEGAAGEGAVGEGTDGAERTAPEKPFRRSRDPIAAFTSDDDHWTHMTRGMRWSKLGDALSDHFPTLAIACFDWSVRHLTRYNELWTANLPASRWDSDGGYEMSEAIAKSEALAARTDHEPPPAWMSRFVAGDLRGAIAAIEELPVPPLDDAWKLLREYASGADDSLLQRALERRLREKGWN